MPPAPELRIALTLPETDLGLLLTQLSVVEDQVPDKLDDPDMAHLAKAELNMVRRVRRQVEAAIGPELAAKLEAEAQQLYGDALDAMGFGEEPDPHMQP